MMCFLVIKKKGQKVNKHIKGFSAFVFFILTTSMLVCQISIRKRDSSEVYVRFASDSMNYDTSILRNGRCNYIQFVFKNQPFYPEVKIAEEMASMCQGLRRISFLHEHVKSVKNCRVTYIPKSFEKFPIEILSLSPSFAIDSVINEWPLKQVHIESNSGGCKRGFESLLRVLSHKDELSTIDISYVTDTVQFYSGFTSLVFFSFSNPVEYLDSNFFFLPNIKHIQVSYKAVSSYIHELDFSHLAPWKLGIRLLFDLEEYEFSLEVIESLKKRNPYVLWMPDYYLINH